MNPQLSVVVPFYGVEKYFYACLDSIRQQRVRDIEVILVDDGSPDGSRAIAEHFVGLDPRFSLVSQPNAGLGPARNTGTAQASGEYLTFVDSDDLVSAGGFETMVGSLDRSGSSFAGGNARRFNNSAGVRQSWSHRNAFARTRVATHILEAPVLARDRMVWNKVYRRSFWDEYCYEFPSIRYEDYPVTLKAHLEAVTVDVISDAVYFWRERESGDSITQQAYRFDNLLDRVVSAEMVLDQADTSTPRVRREVYSALNESDFVTIVQAFASVPESDVPALLDLGGRLADRLGENMAGIGHPYTLVQYRALRARDAELLRELAEFRGGGGLRGSLRGTRHPLLPWRLEYPYPGLGRRSVARSMFVVPPKEIRLATTVTEVIRADDSLILRGTAEIRHHPTTETTRIDVRVGTGRTSVPLDVTTFDAVDSHGDRRPVGFEVTLPAAVLNELQATGSTVSPIEVVVTSGRTRRAGRLHGAAPGNPQWTPCLRISDEVWAQPATTSKRHLVIAWLRRPWVLESAEAQDGGVRLRVSGPSETGPAPSVRIDGHRGSKQPDLVFPLVPLRANDRAEFEAYIPAANVVGRVTSDDPFLHQSVRGLKVDLDLTENNSPELLLWQAPAHGVGVTLRDHLVRVTRSQGNRVSLVESLLRIVAEQVAFDGDYLVVSGTNWTQSSDPHIEWRQYLPNSDDFIREVGTLELDGSRWRLSTPLLPLMETTADSLDLEHRGEWVLFGAWDGREASAVVPDPFLLTGLPLLHDAGSRRGTVTPIGETLHLRVSDRS